ncbi:MAG: response regulator [Planctomycetota bacterium]|nr:MAG: response regulator [Planctomycetota bacterium]
MKILLIEDETAIRSALTRALGRWGHDVVAAGSLTEARACAQNDAPEVVVSDLKLPDGSGLEVAIELGQPFVLMSGYGSFEDAVEAFRNGCVDFLTKPVALQQLKEALHRIGDHRGSVPTVVVDSDDVSLVRPRATNFVSETLAITQLHWHDLATAQAQVETLSHAGLRCRQVLAELAQVPGASTMTVNRDDEGWRFWLPLEVDWDDPAHRDRRQVIEDCADRCWWRPQGVMVECFHER